MIGSVHPDGRHPGSAMALMEQLIVALELRDAADPDSPPWMAEREIRRLEREIVVSLRGGVWCQVGSASSRVANEFHQAPRTLAMTGRVGVVHG